MKSLLASIFYFLFRAVKIAFISGGIVIAGYVVFYVFIKKDGFTDDEITYAKELIVKEYSGMEGIKVRSIDLAREKDNPSKLVGFIDIQNEYVGGKKPCSATLAEKRRVMWSCQ